MCRHFLHTCRFNVIVCIRTIEDLRRFQGEEKPNDRALCWVDLSDDEPQVDVYGGDEKGDDGEAKLWGGSGGDGYGDNTLTMAMAVNLAGRGVRYRVLVTGKAGHWVSINEYIERERPPIKVHELGDGLTGNPAAGLHEEIRIPGLESADGSFKCSLRDAFIAAGGESPAADLQACLEDVLFRCVTDEDGEWQGNSDGEGKEGKEREKGKGGDAIRPPACICGVYVDGDCDIMVRICIRDVTFLQQLRGAVLSGTFERKLEAVLTTYDEKQQERGGLEVLRLRGDDAALLRIQKLDRSDFALKYESNMLSLDTLTTHQEQKLREIQIEDRKRQHVHVRAPAGAGKTFVALHYILGKLLKSDGAGARKGGNEGYVLFVARNRPLAFFVAHWIWARIENETPRKKRHVWEHLHILTASTDDGDDEAEERGGPPLIPFTVSVDQEDQKIVFKPIVTVGGGQPGDATLAKSIYDLVVIDEAHHVYRDAALADFVEMTYMRHFEGQRVVLSDMSQALTGEIKYPDDMKGQLTLES